MDGPQSPAQILNVAEMKRAKKAPKKPYKREPIGKWLIYGGVVSLIFLLLGIIKTQFLFISPVGILLGGISWFIKSLFAKFNLKDNLK